MKAVFAAMAVAVILSACASTDANKPATETVAYGSDDYYTPIGSNLRRKRTEEDKQAEISGEAARDSIRMQTQARPTGPGR